MDANFRCLSDDFEYTLADQPMRNNATFTLLGLPPELWSRICELVVPCDQLINIACTRPRHLRSDKPLGPRPPAISQVCRLLRQESLSLFYRHNNFDAFFCGDLDCISKWLPAIGVCNLLDMKTLTLYAYTVGHDLSWLGDLSGLRIKVRVGEAHRYRPEMKDFHTLTLSFA